MHALTELLDRTKTGSGIAASMLGLLRHRKKDYWCLVAVMPTLEQCSDSSFLRSFGLEEQEAGPRIERFPLF
jgi:hypothetical protein